MYVQRRPPGVLTPADYNDTDQQTFDASVTCGNVTLARTPQGGWVIETFGPVDLAQLDAAVQWAKHAPKPAAPPAPSSEPDVVAEGTELLMNQGSFGAVDGGGFAISVIEGDIEPERKRLEHLAFDALKIECEGACAVDADRAVLEMALEQRVATMLRRAGDEWGMWNATPQTIRDMEVHPGTTSSGQRPDEFKWAFEYKQLVEEVEYLDTVRTYLATRRRERDVGHACVSWEAYRHALKPAVSDVI